MVIKSCPLLMKDTETCVESSLASYFVLFSLISFCFRWFRFISLILFRFVSFLLISFRFVSFSLISFRFVSCRFYFVSHFIGTLEPRPDKCFWTKTISCVWTQARQMFLNKNQFLCVNPGQTYVSEQKRFLVYETRPDTCCWTKKKFLCVNPGQTNLLEQKPQYPKLLYVLFSMQHFQIQ